MLCYFMVHTILPAHISFSLIHTISYPCSRSQSWCIYGVVIEFTKTTTFPVRFCEATSLPPCHPWVPALSGLPRMLWESAGGPGIFSTGDSPTHWPGSGKSHTYTTNLCIITTNRNIHLFRVLTDINIGIDIDMEIWRYVYVKNE